MRNYTYYKRKLKAAYFNYWPRKAWLIKIQNLRCTDSILDILKIQNQNNSPCSRKGFIISGTEFDCTLRDFSFK